MDRQHTMLLLRVSMVAVAIVLFALSLPLVAVHFTPGSNDPSWAGHQFLTCGWMGPCGPQPYFGWFGNPLFALGALLVLLGRHPAVALGGTACFALGLVVALDSLRMVGGGLAPNEGGVTTLHFASFGVGFYLWLASYVVGALSGAIAAGVTTSERSRSAREGPPPASA